MTERRRCIRCDWPLVYPDPVCMVCKWIERGRPPPKHNAPLHTALYPPDAMAHDVTGRHWQDKYESDYD